MRLLFLSLTVIASTQLSGCGVQPEAEAKIEHIEARELVSKPVVYQVFIRLYGNQNSSNIPWGTIEQNGVGKFNDINNAAFITGTWLIEKICSTHHPVKPPII